MASVLPKLMSWVSCCWSASCAHSDTHAHASSRRSHVPDMCAAPHVSYPWTCKVHAHAAEGPTVAGVHCIVCHCQSNHEGKSHTVCHTVCVSVSGSHTSALCRSSRWRSTFSLCFFLPLSTLPKYLCVRMCVHSDMCVTIHAVPPCHCTLRCTMYLSSVFVLAVLCDVLCMRDGEHLHDERHHVRVPVT